MQKKNIYIRVQRFLTKTIEARGLGGALSPPKGSRAMPWKTRVCKSLNNFAIFFIKHAKMVIVRVNIGQKISTIIFVNPKLRYT